MANSPERIGFRTFEVPTEIADKIRSVALEKWGLDLSTDKSLKQLASSIMKMSDFYLNSPLERTPWDEKWCQEAQLCYFLPLNYLRNRSVVLEGNRFGFFEGVKTATDFGAGLGAAQIAFRHSFSEVEIESIEVAPQANELRRHFISSTTKSSAKQEGDLLICSYSLTEDSVVDLRGYESLMLVEPSLMDDARALQKLRQTLIDQGYSIWAPCTHQQQCPLLLHSEKDWCHDRIHFRRPDWFLELERFLPIKNENVTFSYLLASKRKAPEHKNKARMTGDYLDEKGKARQLMCRGEEREYLSMLSRDGELPEYSRGALIEVPANGTSVGSEFRIKA